MLLQLLQLTWAPDLLPGWVAGTCQHMIYP